MYFLTFKVARFHCLNNKLRIIINLDINVIDCINDYFLLGRILFISSVKQTLRESLKQKALEGANIRKSELANALTQEEINSINQQYQYESSNYDYIKSAKYELSCFIELLNKGDFYYSQLSNGLIKKPKHEKFYEAALEELQDVLSKNPTIENALVNSSADGNIYGTILCPENMPRYKLSRSKYNHNGIVRKVSYQEVVRDFIKSNL